MSDTFIERNAFGTTEAVNSRVDLTNIIPDNKQDYTEATFDIAGPNLNNIDFHPAIDDTIDEQVELTTDEIISFICLAISKQPNVLIMMSKPEKLESILQSISARIEKLTGFNINIVKLFKEDSTIRAAIQLIAKGYMIHPKFENTSKGNGKFVFLTDVNNVHVTPNAFDKGLHKYKNKLAVTTLDERVINRAKSFLNACGVTSFKQLLDKCRDVTIYKAPPKRQVSVSNIRALSKKDLAESVLNNELTLNDLKRAGIDNRIISSIQALM